VSTAQVAESKTEATESDSDLKRVEFGFRVMPTFSNFNLHTNTTSSIKSEVTLGYGVGVMLAYNLTRHLGIQTGVVYNSFSQKYKDQYLDHQINVSYINIPALLSLNTNKTKIVNFNIVFGPELGINVGSNIKGGNSSPSDTLTAVFAIKKNDFGMAYGAGLEFMLNEARSFRLDIGYRGIYGFTNISNTSQTTETNSYYIIDKANIRSNSIYAGLTFLF
jgi:opacity protein-like surface antigen